MWHPWFEFVGARSGPDSGAPCLYIERFRVTSYNLAEAP